MDEDNILRLLIRRRGTILAILILSAIAYSGVRFWATHAFISLEITAISQTQSITVYAISEKEKVPKEVNSKLAIVSRDTKTLIATAGDRAKTQTTVAIPWHGFVSKKIQIIPDKNAEKIAFRSTFPEACPIYRPTADSLAYYNCKRQNVLIQNTNSVSNRWSSQVLYEIDSIVKPVSPYMGGYVSIADLTEGEGPSTTYIRAVDENGKVTSYETPAGLPREDLISSRIYADTHNTKNKHFAIVSNVGDIFIGTPAEDNKVDYKIITAPASYDSSHNQTLCRFVSEEVYCYRGHWRIGEVPEGFDYSETTASQILVYSFANGSEKIHKLTQNIDMLEDMKVTANGEVFVQDSQFLYHLTKIGDVYEPTKIAVYPTTIEASDTLYYIHNKSVYAVDKQDPSTARQIFYSPNIVPRSLYAVDNKVFILGSNKKTSQTTYAYRLLDEPHLDTGKRLIDVLPVAATGNPYFYFSDLVGDQIYLSINLAFKNRTQQQIDEDFAKKTESSLNYLRSLGITVDESKITFGR